MFKTELHCHSKDISFCARVSAEDIVNKFYGAGYSTLVLTNHFNTDTFVRHDKDDWNAFIDKYVGACENLQNVAGDKMNILLGAELRFDKNINDYLVYGISKEFMKNFPDMFKMELRDFRKLANEHGCIVVQAHPFRFDMVVSNPEYLDGVEVHNGHKGHNSNNDIAHMWAEKYSLIKTSGTDFHYPDVPANSGIMTDFEIKTSKQLVDTLKRGNYKLIEE